MRQDRNDNRRNKEHKQSIRLYSDVKEAIDQFIAQHKLSTGKTITVSRVIDMALDQFLCKTDSEMGGTNQGETSLKCPSQNEPKSSQGKQTTIGVQSGIPEITDSQQNLTESERLARLELEVSYLRQIVAHQTALSTLITAFQQTHLPVHPNSSAPDERP
jgi:hypothetical protein